jgi:hypothetical protein
MKVSVNMKKVNSKLWLLSAGLALPGLALVIALFVVKDITVLNLITLIALELAYGFLGAFSVTGFINLRRFTAANPSYKNYASKNDPLIATLFLIAACLFYVAKLCAYVVRFADDSSNLMSFSPAYLCFYIPMFLSYYGIMSDENIYLGNYRETIPIAKIRVDDFEALDASMLKFDEYIRLEFHCEGKPYITPFSRKVLVDLCKVLPGVNRDYLRTPNSRKSPQKFY